MSGEAFQLSPTLRSRLAQLVEGRTRAEAFCDEIDACIRRLNARTKLFGSLRSSDRVASLRALETALAAVHELTTDPVVQSTFRHVLLENANVSREAGPLVVDALWITEEMFSEGLAAVLAAFTSEGRQVPPSWWSLPRVPAPDVQELDATVSAALLNVRVLLLLWERSVRVGNTPNVLRSQLLADLVHACRSFKVNDHDRDDAIEWVCAELGVALPQNATHRRLLISAAGQRNVTSTIPPLP